MSRWTINLGFARSRPCTFEGRAFFDSTTGQKITDMTYREPISESDKKQPTSPRRRSRRTAEQSREQILRAATVEFATHGLAGGRISRIVKKAGTNPRMIYEHFGSKSALYVATLESTLAELRAEELTLDVEHLDPLEGLLQLFD